MLGPEAVMEGPDFCEIINKTYMASIAKRKEQVNELRKAHFPFGFEGTLPLTQTTKAPSRSIGKSTTNSRSLSRNPMATRVATSLSLLMSPPWPTILTSLSLNRSTPNTLMSAEMQPRGALRRITSCLDLEEYQLQPTIRMISPTRHSPGHNQSTSESSA